VSVLVRSFAAAAEARCPRCGSGELSRLMSRFAMVKSEDARLDALGDAADVGDVDENDPRSVARYMKRMGDEMGEDLGEDIDAAMDEAMGEDATDEAGVGGEPAGAGGEDDGEL
jgi:hypothetical protein